MSFEDNISAQRELRSLTERESDLCAEMQQIVSRQYLEAWQQHTVREPFLREFVVDTDEPTLAFRLDSKDIFSIDTNRPNVKRQTRDRHYVYVPKDWVENNDGEFVPKFWFRRFEPDASPRMYVVESRIDHELAGIRRYRMPAELRRELYQIEAGDQDDDTPVQIEFDLDTNFLAAGVKEKKANLEELETLKRATLGKSEIVAWNS